MTTTMSAALAKAGITAAQMKAYAACRDFIEAGGTLDQWIEVFKLTSQKLPNEAPFECANNGQGNNGNVRQPQASDGGHDADASSSHARIAPVARPQSSRDIAAAASVTKVIALTAFERELTHTGRQWGNVYYRELDSMREDGEIALAIKAHIGSLRGDARHKKLNELMTPRQFMSVLRKARGDRHAA